VVLKSLLNTFLSAFISAHQRSSLFPTFLHPLFLLFRLEYGQKRDQRGEPEDEGARLVKRIKEGGKQ
jgi:hypothetical protein